MAQFVDLEAAKEFMKEALDKIPDGEASRICQDLESKSARFQEILAREQIETLTEEQFIGILRLIFVTRRKAGKLIEAYGFDQLKGETQQLLYGEAAVQERLQQFCSQLDKHDVNLTRDLGSELLHFTDPEQYWLWTRWIWDPKTKTGALPLVITEDYDLQAETLGESYLKTGKAMAFVRHVGEAAGFEVIKSGHFGVDAYLCFVYIVYVYTVLRMRMTQEFNQVIPGLTEFSRRLLGIYKQKEPKNAG